MIVNRERKSVHASDDFATINRQFTANDPAFIFDVLCNKMYSNPFYTMLQEYLANGRDAHREIGANDTPLFITMPSEQDPHLHIRDFGPGLSEERINDVFIHLGRSTKNTDDTMTGGFGLGAKIGWAYGDSYTIISYYEGTQTTYLAYRDENGVGALATLDVASTEAPNGVEIKLSIKYQDVGKITKVISKITYFWEVAPICTTHTFDHYDRPTTDTTILYDKVSFDTSYSGSYYAIVDGIPYSLSATSVPILSALQLPENEGRSLCLFFDVSEVDVSVNREGLNYSSKTIDMITHTIQSVIDRNSEEALSAIHIPSFKERVEVLSGCYTKIGAPKEVISKINNLMYLHFGYKNNRGVVKIIGCSGLSETAIYRVEKKVRTKTIIKYRSMDHSYGCMKTTSVYPDEPFVSISNLKNGISVPLYKERRRVLLTKDANLTITMESAKNIFRTVFDELVANSFTMYITQNKMVFDFLVNELGFESMNDIQPTLPPKMIRSSGDRACNFSAIDVKSVFGRSSVKTFNNLDKTIDCWCSFKEREAAKVLLEKHRMFLSEYYKNINCYYVTNKQASLVEGSEVMHYTTMLPRILNNVPSIEYEKLISIFKGIYSKVSDVKSIVEMFNEYKSESGILHLISNKIEEIREDHIVHDIIRTKCAKILFSSKSRMISNVFDNLKYCKYLKTGHSQEKSSRLEKHYAKHIASFTKEHARLERIFKEEYPLFYVVNIYECKRNANNPEALLKTFIHYLNGDYV